MATIWRNGHIATMAEQKSFAAIEHAAMVTDGGKIIWVGEEKALPEEYASIERCFDIKGHWVTPGLVDCHTHLVYAGTRAHEFELRMQGMSYADIAKRGGGIVSTVLATRSASEEDLLAQSAKRLKAMMREGVTTVEIKSGYGLTLEDEIKMLKVAKKLQQDFAVTISATFLGAHTVAPEYKTDPDAYIDLVCTQMIPRIHEQGLADAVDVFCESIAFNLAQTERVFKAATELGLKIKCHAEQLSNLGASFLASQYKAISCDHLEYIPEASIKALAQSATVAVLLPGAYYFLQEKKKPPVELLREAGVQMAVATDCNPGSSPTTSLGLMMNMGTILLGLTPCEVLHGATRVAAKALALENEIGSIEVGKYADFAIWDIVDPAELAYAFGVNPLVNVIKRAKVVDL